MSLAFALAGTLVLCGGCSQGEGDRCEINSDCASGLVCAATTGSVHNGVCRRPGSGGGTGQDAAGPVSTPDAASDGPAVVADAGGEGPFVAADAATSVDAPVMADDATVGVDDAPDAKAAADLSSTD